MNIPDKVILNERMKKIRLKAEKAAQESGRNFEEIKIIAVSKTHPVEYIYNAMDAGIQVFGENYAQELRDKFAAFEASKRKSPEWHYIGGLQRSNVKLVTPFVDMIHSVDSEKILKEVSNRAGNVDRNIDILIQVNTSGESAKSGCEPDDAVNLVSMAMESANITVKGLMTIGTFTDDDEIRIREFSLLRNTLESINTQLGINLKELSMGMTSDYPLAIKEGATMVRVGTALFGERDYNN